jgi:hypothetical protein
MHSGRKQAVAPLASGHLTPFVRLTLVVLFVFLFLLSIPSSIALLQRKQTG